MRHWVKDCFCVGLSYSIALPTWVGKRLIFGSKAAEKHQLSEVFAGFMIGVVGTLCLVLIALSLAQ